MMSAELNYRSELKRKLEIPAHELKHVYYKIKQAKAFAHNGEIVASFRVLERLELDMDNLFERYGDAINHC